MHEYFRIHGGAENCSLPLEFLTQLDCVYQISVVSDRIMVVAVENNEGLRICQKGRSSGGIANMPDSNVAPECFKCLLTEYIVHQTHVFIACDLVTVPDGNSGAFLPPVLKSVEAEISYLGAILMTENPEDSALFLFIRGKRSQNLRVLREQ